MIYVIKTKRLVIRAFCFNKHLAGTCLLPPGWGSEAEKILEEAMSLSDEDRRRLGEALLDTVPRDTDEEIAAAWRGEVLRRIDEVRSGEATTESYSEVKGHLKAALDSAR